MDPRDNGLVNETCGRRLANDVLANCLDAWTTPGSLNLSKERSISVSIETGLLFGPSMYRQPAAGFAIADGCETSLALGYLKGDKLGIAEDANFWNHNYLDGGRWFTIGEKK